MHLFVFYFNHSKDTSNDHDYHKPRFGSHQLNCIAIFTQPVYFEVINESGGHNVPKGSETHFRIVVVSSQFDDLNLIEVSKNEICNNY